MSPSLMPGAWSASELRETAELFAGAGSDSEMPPEVRFLRAVARLLVKRRTRDGALNDTDTAAVLILETRERNDPFLEPFSLEPMLDQAMATINGRLWLANEKLTFGHFVEHQHSGVELFDWVVDTLGLGSRPAVIFDPTVDGGELRYYANGLSDMGEVKAYPLGAVREVTFKQAHEVIDLVHTEHLASPHTQVVSTWKKARSHWAANNAEALIQSLIKVALKSTFLFCEVDKEGNVKTGRFDLTISYVDPSTRTRTCYGVLELKVLKSAGSGGATVAAADNLAAVQDGLVQAYSYRDNLSASWAALCCFDMRKDADATEECFTAIAGEANKHDVNVSRWRLYNSVKKYRESISAS